MTLHEIIKQRLKERGKLLKDLLEFMDISSAGYGKAINNEAIKLRQVEKIAEFLEIPVPELLLPLYYEESEKDLIQSSINYVRNKANKVQTSSL